MSRVRSFALGVWYFVVGDDWRLATGVVTALSLTALVAHLIGRAWWILPVAVFVLMASSVWREARTARPAE